MVYKFESVWGNLNADCISLSLVDLFGSLTLSFSIKNEHMYQGQNGVRSREKVNIHSVLPGS